MKKFLSLALSLAMVFSMFTFLSVGASAVDAEATYSDYNTIQYKEAVSVISALDIMGGYSGGTFGPDGNLTRGAATKIICNMMVGPTTANRLPAPSGDATIFFDVPSTHTFAATIAYCAENNFISGYSDGSFHPGDPLSGNAFLKMLLCALGYDQDVEGYRNTSAWATNVVARAVEAGLMDEMPDDFDGRTSLTREQAAELAFEALQADMVEYESNNSTIVINPDGSISSTPVKSNLRTRAWKTSNTNANNISNKTTTEGNIIQFAELKFSNLKRDEQVDDFGRPSTKWTWHGDEIGEYADKVVKTYWGSKDIGDIYKDLGLNANEYAQFYVNGERQPGDDNSIYDDILISKNRAGNANELKEIGARTYTAATNTLAAANSTTTITDPFYGDATKIGDGARVDVFYDKDADYNPAAGDYRIQICAQINYAGKVTSVKRASGSDPRKITIEFAGDSYKTPTGVAFDTAEFETTDFAVDDIVTFTYANNEIQTVEKLTAKVTGNLTRYSRGNSLTISNSLHSYASMIAFDATLMPNSPNLDNTTANTATITGANRGWVPYTDLQERLSTDDDYIVYLNSSDQVMWVEEADKTDSDDGSSGYALVRWIESEFYNDKDSNQASLLFTNGTRRTVDLYKDYLKDWYNAAGGGTYPNANDINNIAFNYNNGPAPDLVVHYNRDSSGSYKLTRQENTHFAFSNSASISNRQISGNWTTSTNSNNWTGSVINLTQAADSSTKFIIDDDGTYRTYTGIRNAPNVTNGTGYAYIDNDGAAKYIWIVKTTNVTTSSRDITFIAPASRSDLFEEDSNIYYTYNAVVAGEIKTIMVDARTTRPTGSLVLNGTSYFVSGGGTIADSTTNFGVSLAVNGGGGTGLNNKSSDKAWNGVILNNTTTNSDDILTDGYFSSTSVKIFRAHGIKAPSNYEIELNTNNNPVAVGDGGVAKGSKRTLPNNFSTVNAYEIDDDGNITRLGNVMDIQADSDAWVFWTENDDDEITNIFVCEDNS